MEASPEMSPPWEALPGHPHTPDSANLYEMLLCLGLGLPGTWAWQPGNTSWISDVLQVHLHTPGEQACSQPDDPEQLGWVSDKSVKGAAQNT